MHLFCVVPKQDKTCDAQMDVELSVFVCGENEDVIKIRNLEQRLMERKESHREMVDNFIESKDRFDRMKQELESQEKSGGDLVEERAALYADLQRRTLNYYDCSSVDPSADVTTTARKTYSSYFWGLLGYS